jgi:hypothetical protein
VARNRKFSFTQLIEQRSRAAAGIRAGQDKLNFVPFTGECQRLPVDGPNVCKQNPMAV